MDIIDCSCGVCGSKFQIIPEAYKKRTVNDSASYVKNQIQCPTCNATMPPSLLSIVLQITLADNLQGWSMGTNFPKDR